MGADSLDTAVAAAHYVGVTLSRRQQKLLETFHSWLSDEALRAGGIGPREQDRLWSRHIADSLVFGLGLGDASDCVDVGTGVGLPGIPLAIAYPNVQFALLDRSGRRCDLVRRAIAVLGLQNCEVIQSDVASMDEQFDCLVSRAAIPPDEMMIHVKRLLRRPGTGVIALSRVGEVEISALEEPGFTVSLESLPPEVLDSVAYLLRIEAT